MSLFNSLDRNQHFAEFGDPLVTNEGVLTPATRKARALANLGLTATAAELNVLAGVTAGTVTASKAVVVDANKDIATFRNLTLSGNLVTGSTTLSEAELAVVDGVTAGTVAASKAAVVDANKDIKQFRNLRTVRVLSDGGSPTSINTAGGATYSAANLLTGIIVRDPNGAGRTDTLETAANLVAAIPGATVGDTLEVLIVNGADAAEAITLAAGTGGGFDTNQTASSRVIGQNTSKSILIRLTNVSGGSEAYVIYA